MSNNITGKVLAIGQAFQIQTKDPSRPLIKREVTIDCTRHDPYTGERSSFENTPVLEFAGDIVTELESIHVGDVVTISFDIVGVRYTDRATNQQRIFTRIRPYKIELRQPQQQPAPQQYATAPQQQPGQYYQPQPAPQQPQQFPPPQYPDEMPF